MEIKNDLSDELFLFPIEIDQIIENSYLSNYIYHYTDSNTIKLILGEDNISLRLTRYDCFRDTQEGKHIIPVYQRIIEEMQKQKLIDIDFYETIKSLRPEKRMFIFEDSNSTENNWKGHSVCCDCQVYIFCFSSTGESEYMFNTYVKNNDKKGASLEFDSSTLKYSVDWYGKGFGIELKCVLDESDDTYRIISSQIQKWYDMYQKSLKKSDDLERIKMLIAYLLSELQYYVKLKDFDIENEVRLVLFIPDNQQNTYVDVIQGDKHYTYVRMGKDAFTGLDPAPDMEIGEKMALTHDIQNKGYDFITKL